MQELIQRILSFAEAQLTCSICSDIMNSPVMIKCGHVFCCGCIEHWFQTKENCPCCRESCAGGAHSEGIEPLNDCIRVLKPLLISKDKEDYREVQRTLSSAITPTPSFNSLLQREQDEQSKRVERQRRVLEEYVKEKLVTARTQTDFDHLEVALTLVSCAIAKSDYSKANFLKDMESFKKNPHRIVEKYMNHVTMTDPDFLYLPTTRRKTRIFHWPNKASAIQIFTLILVGVLCYVAVVGLEKEGYRFILEPVSKAISFVNLCMDLLLHLNA